MTTQTVELDPETGLPALPEGYIWRVKSTSDYLTLQLVKVTKSQMYYRKWVFWKEEYTQTEERVVDEAYLNINQLAPNRRTSYNIREALVNLAKQLWIKKIREQDQWDIMRSFHGDYPPKNLNSV